MAGAAGHARDRQRVYIATVHIAAGAIGIYYILCQPVIDILHTATIAKLAADPVVCATATDINHEINITGDIIYDDTHHRRLWGRRVKVQLYGARTRWYVVVSNISALDLFVQHGVCV